MKKIQIPLFPLNGVIIFPRSNLPLNIFESRYIEMINHSISNDRLIGMIQSDKKNNFYKIGCLGKITSFSETKDGRYVVNLLGQSFFKFRSKVVDKKKFISANIETVIEQKNDRIEKFEKELLIYKYKNFIDDQEFKININLVQKIDTEELIKLIAMSCPFSTEDKQMLLETYDIFDLGNKLISLFDFYPNNKNTTGLIN